MINIAICDDERSECNLMEQYIYKIVDKNEDMDLSVFESGIEFMKSLELNCDYDIILLDYELDGCDGRSIGMRIRELGNHNSIIIYVSNHSEAIFDLLDADIFNFIKKPIDYGRFEQVFLAALNNAKSNDKKLKVKIGKHDIYIDMREIIYIESIWRQVNIHTSKQEYLVYAKLDEIEKKLKIPSKIFVRISKSYVVNLNFVKEVGAKSIIMDDDSKFEISHSYSDSFKDHYYLYLRRRNLWIY